MESRDIIGCFRERHSTGGIKLHVVGLRGIEAGSEKSAPVTPEYICSFLISSDTLQFDSVTRLEGISVLHHVILTRNLPKHYAVMQLETIDAVTTGHRVVGQRLG